MNSKSNSNTIVNLVTIIMLLLPSYSMAAVLPDFVPLVEAAAPAVVNISTEREVSQRQRQNNSFGFPGGEQLPELFRYFFEHQFPGQSPDNQPRRALPQSLGSGFIVSQDGYILTNQHVVKEADKIVVLLNDRRQMLAELIGIDESSDLALLKIDAQDLPFLQLADSSQLRVGEWVLAIGSPFGFDYSVTAGIVSAKGRSLDSEQYVPFIQTDVAINPGNSGGPLFNLAGEVVGINSQIYTRSGGFMGLSFAIPSNTAKVVMEQLRDSGVVKRGWLGVRIQEVNRDLAESFALDKASGVLVAEVMVDSPAEAAGIEVGDIITYFNDVEVQLSSRLPHLVGAVPPNQKAVVELVRDGKKLQLDVTIGLLPQQEQLAAADSRDDEPGLYSERLGLRVVVLDEEVRQQWRTRYGVMIKTVGDGVAAQLGLRPGDVITRLGGHTIETPEQFIKLVEQLPVARPIAMHIIREGMSSFVAFRLR